MTQPLGSPIDQRVDAYAAWVRDLRHGAAPAPLVTREDTRWRGSAADDLRLLSQRDQAQPPAAPIEKLQVCDDGRVRPTLS